MIIIIIQMEKFLKGDLYKIWIIFSAEKKKQTDTQGLRVFGLKQTLLNLLSTSLLMQKMTSINTSQIIIFPNIIMTYVNMFLKMDATIKPKSTFMLKQIKTLNQNL